MLVKMYTCIDTKFILDSCCCYRNVIPDNLFEATFAQTQTKYMVSDKLAIVPSNNGTQNETVKEVTKYLGKMGNPNIIGNYFGAPDCIIFCTKHITLYIKY